MNKNLQMSNRAGYVYVLSNPVMPGIVKIGRSIHGGRTRAMEIYKQGGTGVPMPFKMEFEVFDNNCVRLEEEVHELLVNCRINESREFFKIEPSKAKMAILRVICANHDHVVEHADFVINGRDLLENYGSYLDEDDACVATLDLTHSLDRYLTKEEVRNAIARYEAECERRRLLILAGQEIY
jgi:hypothetical protein